MSKVPRRARWTCLLGTAVLLVSGLLVWRSRDALLGRWYLYRLGSSDAEVQRFAAERLASLGTLEAFPFFAAAARERGIRGSADGRFTSDC